MKNSDGLLRPGRRRLAVATLGSLAALALGPGLVLAASAPVRILVVGDSLSAEYGIERDTGWVALLREKLASEGIQAEVDNASISGDTTAGGRARLPRRLEQLRPTHVIIELGGNDALRGLDLSATRDNLATMIRDSQAAGARVLLVGMRVPPNYGPYAEQFAQLFPALAQEYDTALVPFLLEPLVGRRELFQPDGIHPTESAQSLLLKTVWPGLRHLLPAT